MTTKAGKLDVLTDLPSRSVQTHQSAQAAATSTVAKTHLAKDVLNKSHHIVLN